MSNDLTKTLSCYIHGMYYITRVLLKTTALKLKKKLLFISVIGGWPTENKVFLIVLIVLLHFIISRSLKITNTIEKHLTITLNY